MATLSNPVGLPFVAQTPGWCRVEFEPSPQNFTTRMRVGVRCKDGFVTLVDEVLWAEFNHAFAGCSRRQLLQHMQELIATQLATLTLEE